jgi:hypothetical protein
MPAAPSGTIPPAAVSFPKAERPFKPGEFSSAPEPDESTRIAPLDATGGGRVASGSHPRPAAGQPMIPDGPSTRREDPRVMGTGAVQAIGGPMGMQGMPGMQPDMNQVGQSGGYPQQGYPQQQQQGYPGQGGYPGASASGAYGVMPGGNPGMPGMGPSMAPGGYGSMTPQGGMQQPGGPPPPAGDLMSKLKANSIPKIVAGLLFIIGGILYLAEDDEPPVPKKKPVASLEAGAPTGSGSGASAAAGSAPTSPPVMGQQPTGPTGPSTQAWPPGVPCPPPNWPPNTPLPCTPNGLTATSDRNPPERGGKDGGTKASDPRDGGAAPLPPGTKTLERQAVDFVASGDTAKAAAAYEELVRRDPNNQVYAEAARILRAKLDAGAQ